MKPIVFIFALLLPLFANAGAYEDMEAMIRQDRRPSSICSNAGRCEYRRSRRKHAWAGDQARSPDAVDYLMAHRARLNPRNKHGETAISIAAYNGRTAYVKKLVEAGAEVNYGWPPLSNTLPVYNGHLEIVDYLLKHGAEAEW